MSVLSFMDNEKRNGASLTALGIFKYHLLSFGTGFPPQMYLTSESKSSPSTDNGIILAA